MHVAKRVAKTEGTTVVARALTLVLIGPRKAVENGAEPLEAT
jgi:hypothetical protein